MKLYIASLFVIGASAFSPAQQSKTFTSTTALEATQTRQQFMAAALATATTLAVPNAYAAKYGSIGAGSSAVLDPNTAEVDDEIMTSSAVQTALKSIRKYKSVVKDMQNALAGDNQVDLKTVIAKELDFSALRDTLNTFGTAFEEDTQRGTDRLIRVILQDITELGQANTQKDGVPRSPRRLETMQKKLAKLEQAFDDYLAFAK